jgi:hypothetical protein
MILMLMLLLAVAADHTYGCMLLLNLEVCDWGGKWLAWFLALSVA